MSDFAHTNELEGCERGVRIPLEYVEKGFIACGRLQPVLLHALRIERGQT